MTTWPRWPDVDRSRTPVGWSWPANLLVAQGPAAWPRGRRALVEATEILADAVAWWDVERSGFRDGDRWLRNIGQAGGVLDLRLGSSLVANSNDPKFLAPEATGYVYLPGVTGSHVSAPDETALKITGDIDIRVRVSMDDWTPSSSQSLAARYNGAVGAVSWYFSVGTNGRPLVGWVDSASTIRGPLTATAAPTVNDGDSIWMRAVIDVDNGAGQAQAEFYWAPDSVDVPSSWTQLGGAVVGAFGTSSIQGGSVSVLFGNRANDQILSGKVYRAQVLNGIGGTTVLDVDCDALTSGSATSFTASTGQTVTINRSTSGRKSVAMPARRNGGRACMLLGTDDYLEVVDSQQHGLLNFYGGDSFTVMGVIRQWATQPTSTFLGKKADLSTTAGYALYHSGGSNAFNTGDGTSSAFRSSTATLGTLGALVGVRNATAQTMQLTYNGTATATTRGLATPLTTQTTFRVGRTTTYADMEWRMGAIWRRPLTTREITVLTNSGIWGT